MMEVEVRGTAATLPLTLVRTFTSSLPRSVVTANPTERLTAQEADLIRRILAGEKELYYELIYPYQRSVYVAAFSILRSEADAEDCAQDAILKAFRHLGAFRGESKFGSWLVSITLNEAKMKLRKLRPGLYESLDEPVTNDEGDYVPQLLGDWREIPSESLERSEVRDILVRAVQSLSEIYREVFVLRDIEGFNVASTAQMLEVSEAVVKTRLLRARLQMRDRVAPHIKDSSVLSRPSFKKGKNPWR